ncbi:MAG: hypothetical protein WBM78_19180 [Desulfobacterales bacterium]
MKLYWVTTEDHDEDWFVVESGSKKASRFHENMEGYNLGDATAKKVLSIPQNLLAEPGWPSDELLLALGARFIQNDQTRVVDIGGRTFCEGMLAATLNEINDDIFEEIGQKRLNKTKKASLQ